MEELHAYSARCLVAPTAVVAGAAHSKPYLHGLPYSQVKSVCLSLIPSCPLQSPWSENQEPKKKKDTSTSLISTDSAQYSTDTNKAKAAFNCLNRPYYKTLERELRGHVNDVKPAPIYFYVYWDVPIAVYVPLAA